jgi:hypothetical protein
MLSDAALQASRVTRGEPSFPPVKVAPKACQRSLQTTLSFTAYRLHIWPVRSLQRIKAITAALAIPAYHTKWL